MVFGNLSTGYWLGAAGGGATEYKVIGRTAVSSGDDIDVTVTAKDNMMVLQHLVASGNIDQGMHFNDDGGSGGSSNYAWRIRRAGSVTGQGINTYRLNTEETYPHTAFEIHNMQHTNGQEKTVQWNVCQANSAGAGTAPERNEGVGKWVTTGDITKVSFTNIDSGDYASGSEVVVLGCDNDESDSDTNAWEELADVTLSGASDTLIDATITAKKYLMIQEHKIPTGNCRSKYQFNGDTAANYAIRSSDDGGSDATSTSIPEIYAYITGGTSEAFINTYIVNTAAQEKLTMTEIVEQNIAGAGTAPQRRELVGKWANTSNQITSIKVFNDGTGDFDTGSSIKVWGFD